jgi:nucleotide-binding universal stress UspA family protein
MTVSRVLHPVEYSDAGVQAASDTVTLARSYRAALHVVHAESRRKSNQEEPATQLLRNFAGGTTVIPVNCPTLVLPLKPNRVTAENEPLFRNILCPVDSSPTAAAAAELALALAQHSGSRLTTFHVIDGAFASDATDRPDGNVAVLCGVISHGNAM